MKRVKKLIDKNKRECKIDKQFKSKIHWYFMYFFQIIHDTYFFFILLLSTFY